MNPEAIAARVDGFRWTGPGKGIGRCGAVDHLDEHASMSVQDAGDKILLHCLSRHCSIDAICAGLGIEVSDLFVDSLAKGTTSRNDKKKLSKATIVSPYQTGRLLREYAHKLLDIADRFDRHSREVLERARGLKIDDWTDEELERALAIVDRANQRQRLVSALDDLAYDLKTCAMERERKAYAVRS